MLFTVTIPRIYINIFYHQASLKKLKLKILNTNNIIIIWNIINIGKINKNTLMNIMFSMKSLFKYGKVNPYFIPQIKIFFIRSIYLIKYLSLNSSAHTLRFYQNPHEEYIYQYHRPMESMLTNKYDTNITQQYNFVFKHKPFWNNTFIIYIIIFDYITSKIILLNIMIVNKSYTKKILTKTLISCHLQISPHRCKHFALIGVCMLDKRYAFLA